MEKVIGGEFDFLDVPTGKRNNLLDDCCIFSSGRGALYQILRVIIQTKNTHHVFLPDYLCDSIYKVCNALGLSYSFYTIRDNLSINRQELKRTYELLGGVFY